MLPRLETALLWAMRAWVLGLLRDTDVAPRIVAVFTRLGAPEAMASFDGLMRGLAHGARRVLDVNCVCHPRVSGDEQSLLDACALRQAGRWQDALALLGTLTTPAAAAACNDSAARLMAVLNAAGHMLQPNAALRRHAFACAAPLIAQGSARLH